jgi:hypothetical protein
MRDLAYLLDGLRCSTCLAENTNQERFGRGRNHEASL